MPKDKERSVNPAQAQRKAEKAKALKKSRNEQQLRRNEKLARRNPNSIQRQIDDLKALESSGDIKTREKAILAELERDLQAVLKAREQQGVKPTSTGSGGGGFDNKHSSDRRYGRDNDKNPNRTVLGKRRHDGRWKDHNQHEDHSSSGSDTDESVRNIPMPRDTPPPMPRSHHRPHHHNAQQQAQGEEQAREGHEQGQGQGQGQGRNRHDLPTKPTNAPIYESKTTYSSAPQLRNLTKEATSRFVPDAVRKKQDAARGQGGLLEPEEMDRLEQQGYLNSKQRQQQEEPPHQQTQDQTSVVVPQSTLRTTQENAKYLQDEEDRFQAELAQEATDTNMVDLDPDQNPETQGNVNINDNPHNDTNDIDDEEEEDEDFDEEGYLPLSMSGQANSSLPKTSSRPNAASITAGLFGKLPPPKNSASSSSSVVVDVSQRRQVQMEEVEDEDL